jgi:hypothetical protein
MSEELDWVGAVRKWGVPISAEHGRTRNFFRVIKMMLRNEAKINVPETIQYWTLD